MGEFLKVAASGTNESGQPLTGAAGTVERGLWQISQLL